MNGLQAFIQSSANDGFTNRDHPVEGISRDESLNETSLEAKVLFSSYIDPQASMETRETDPSIPNQHPHDSHYTQTWPQGWEMGSYSQLLFTQTLVHVTWINWLNLIGIFFSRGFLMLENYES